MKIIGYALAVVVFAALCLGIYWLLWKLWMFVVPQIFTSWPENILHPNFWLFAGAWWLITLLGRSIFYRGAAK